jgi:cytochrome c biogenesis protein CcmG, thiol:disulfide interchange protein DsbE
MHSQVPQLQLKDANYETHEIPEKNGLPTLINYWTSWCDSCRDELPELNSLYESYHGRINIVAVNLSQKDRMVDAKTYIKQLGFKWNVLFDAEGKAANQYQIFTVPTSFLLNSDGAVVTKFIGKAKLETLKQKIDNVLSDTSR